MKIHLTASELRSIVIFMKMDIKEFPLFLPKPIQAMNKGGTRENGE